MKQNNKQRLFEVMGRLDKTFKPLLKEDVEVTDNMTLPIEQDNEMSTEVEEKTPEEKLQELTAKVDELYALLHDKEETSIDEPEVETGEGEVDMENLQEWNFDKKKGEKKDDKGNDKKNDDEDDSPVEDNEVNLDEIKEPSKKVPVAAIAKVGK